MIANYIEKGMTIVQFQLEHDGNEKNIILSDYRQGAFDATQYLIELGHTRICFVTQDFKNVKSRHERYQGYAEALDKYNITLDEQLIKYWHRETGFETSPKEIFALDNPPTAFFTQHLAITTALLKNLSQENISIPGDVSLLGFDDIPMAEFFKVPISVVKQDPYKIGLEAAKLLLENINDKEKPSYRVMVPCTLTKRDSCKTLFSSAT